MTIFDRFRAARLERKQRAAARAAAMKSLHCALCPRALALNELERGYCDRCWAMGPDDLTREVKDA